MADQSDPFKLSRFVRKQNKDQAQALEELRAGHKCSCWSWWILPTPPLRKGGQEVGSWTNREYALRSSAEAAAFLAHPTLGPNYLDAVTACAEQLERGVTPRSLLGIDVPRLEASAKYFEREAARAGRADIRDACRRALRAMGAEMDGGGGGAGEGGEGGEGGGGGEDGAAGSVVRGGAAARHGDAAPEPAASSSWPSHLPTEVISSQEADAIDAAIEAARAVASGAAAADSAAAGPKKQRVLQPAEQPAGSAGAGDTE